MTEAEELVLRLRTHGAPASERIVGALIEGNRHRDMTIAAQRKVLDERDSEITQLKKQLEAYASKENL